MKVFVHHLIHFGKRQSAGRAVSPRNIFLIFSSLEANLQQRKKNKEFEDKFKPIVKHQVGVPVTTGTRQPAAGLWLLFAGKLRVYVQSGWPLP